MFYFNQSVNKSERLKSKSKSLKSIRIINLISHLTKQKDRNHEKKEQAFKTLKNKTKNNNNIEH